VLVKIRAQRLAMIQRAADEGSAVMVHSSNSSSDIIAENDNPKTSNEALADVSLWGPSLGSGRKYLGGAMTAAKDAIIGVPACASAVVRLELASGAVSYLPGPKMRGRFKWLRGVLARDGAIFCIPACADSVLRIGPNGEVSTIGRGVLPRGEWLWHGGALGRDGNIYAIPANAERVLKIEPESLRVSLIGPALQAGVKNKWYGGIMARDGSIWGMPYNASAALKVVPATGEVREVGSCAHAASNARPPLLSAAPRLRARA
jgi:hypothetical protein